ncbi:hypothetical protein SAMN05444673_3615 [Bacillus sp. OV166]|nr:hypothetical protein SAMN05444673_3615 [Bacillus sp. OV166]
MDLFSRIAEDKIKEAIKNKEFENLPSKCITFIIFY